MIESHKELVQLQARWHTLETKIEELKAKAAKAGAQDMAEFVRQIAALRAKQETTWDELQPRMDGRVN